MHLLEHYKKNVASALKTELNLKNIHAVPRLEKIVVHVAIGSYLAGGKDFSPVVEHVTAITGQKPIITKSKKAISNFKLRIGMPVGVTVTLRGKRMFDFLTRLTQVVLPRIRDFQGISRKSFDKNGNYTMGIKEYSTFPDIASDDMSKNHGIEITINTTAKDNKSGLLLLKHLGFPFKKE